MENRKSNVKKPIGFVLVMGGILLFWLCIPILAPKDLPATWISIWPAWVIVSLLGIGGLLLSNLPLRYSIKVLLIVLGLSIPWSLILFLPLDNYEYLLAVAVLGVGVLLYRHYYHGRDLHIQGESQ